MEIIKCEICSKELRCFGRHLRSKHNMSIREYKLQFPDSLTSCQETKDLRKQKCLQKYGVENPKQVKEFQDKGIVTCIKTYGVRNPSQNKEISKKATIHREEAFQRKYGVKHNMKVPEIAKKAGETKKGRKQSQSSNEKRSVSVKSTFLKTYGVTGPGGLIKEVHEGMKRKYGAENPSQVPELKRKAIKNSQLKPNKPEKIIIDLNIPSLQYNASGEIIIQDSTTKKLRIPDFIVKDQNKVVEHFGSFDHGPIRTGKPKEEHEREVIEWYKKNGYSCLVVWDCTFKNLTAVKEKIQEFIFY